MAWLMEYSNPTLAYAPFSSAIQKDKDKDKNKDKNKDENKDENKDKDKKENKVFCMVSPNQK
ncbi:hypothetical protein KKKH50_06580 [Helicobacter pylori]